MARYVVQVWWSDVRPIQPDQRTAWVILEGLDTPAGAIEARWLATAMVAGSRLCEMVTRAEIVSVVL